jgi:hypothetical protein
MGQTNQDERKWESKVLEWKSEADDVEVLFRVDSGLETFLDNM